MTPLRLAARSLAFYWRSNLAVAAGVATAVCVLAGALIVGDSVRDSLRELALARLGRVELVLRAGQLFREELAQGLTAGGAAAPLLVLEGTVSHEASGRRAFQVAVYGVDARFWALQGEAGPAPAGGARELVLSEALAAELGAARGDSLLLRVQAPGDVPGASLFGERDDLGRTLRLTFGDRRSRAAEFSLRPNQQAVRAVFVPLAALQRALKQDRKVNTVVLAGAAGGEEDLARRLRAAVSLEDLGLRLRPVEEGLALSLESASGLLPDAVAAAATQSARELSLEARPLLTYLANSLRVGERELPYSLVTGVDAGQWPMLAGMAGQDAILLNEWAAAELLAQPGQPLQMTYYLWDEGGRLLTRPAAFVIAGSVPVAAGDRDMTPDYPGITEAARVADWAPPFPIDLRKIGSRDEDYWNAHRGTPKAFVPLARAQALWGHRLGSLSALRIGGGAVDAGGAVQGVAGGGAAGGGKVGGAVVGDAAGGEAAGTTPAVANAVRDRFAAALLERLDPQRHGFELLPVRRDALLAARGSTDFDQYFLYFSSFLIASALLLVGLFFRLGVEQRLPELGLLRAVGFKPADVRRQLLGEGLLLAALSSLPGAAAAAGFAALVLWGLGRFGTAAVSTRELTLHVTPLSPLLGALAGVAFAALTLALTLRALLRLPPRALLLGEREDAAARAARRESSLLAAAVGLLLAVGMGVAGSRGVIDPVAGFFGSGVLSLLALLAFARRSLREAREGAVVRGLVGLGLRSARRRPGRSLLSIALIGCATFVIVAVGAFRHAGEADAGRGSGTGGYALYGESLLPIHFDPATPEGRAALNLAGPEAEALRGLAFARLRLQPGDDASCLNLYVPRAPRILGAPSAFLHEGRFAFADSLAVTAAQRANPWLLLESVDPEGTIPAIADRNSIQYVLKKKLGSVLELDTPGAGRVRLRLQAALAGSLFQSELIVAEAAFLRMFPRQEGYRVFLLDAPPGASAAVSALVESRLADSGLDLQPAGERLRRYLDVENTYIATFQLLGALGLALGTVGLATVILRNAAERRRELALLRAVGYRPADLRTLVLSENGVLLLAGLLIGGGCALLATLPSAAARGAATPVLEIALLLGALLATGLLVSRLAVAAVVREDLLVGLRSE